MKRAGRARFVACALLVIAARAGANEVDVGATASDSPSTLYLLHCSGCHGADGMGERRADVPPLPPYVGNFLRDPLGRLYVANVGGVTSSGLNAVDTAAVLNWVMARFGERTAPAGAVKFNADEIRALRAKRKVDSVSLRRTIASRLKKQGLMLADYPWP
jgi:mono/diheme cytochrome c family protein